VQVPAISRCNPRSWRLLLYVLLPATALLASIYPELGSFFFSWLEPLGRLMP